VPDFYSDIESEIEGTMKSIRSDGGIDYKQEENMIIKDTELTLKKDITRKFYKSKLNA